MPTPSTLTRLPFMKIPHEHKHRPAKCQRKSPEVVGNFESVWLR
jgi:hypothetical protein